ncbi:MAG TPA: lantibiotic dehydratase [Edaphobacter sp.]|nr:lantibiotic dehydratase [Edaphobacter sp.]
MKSSRLDISDADSVAKNLPLTLPGARYGLTRSFILRMPGFPVELIESMASQDLASAADQAYALDRLVDNAVRSLLSSSKKLDKKTHRALKRQQVLDPASSPGFSEGALEEFNALLVRRSTARDHAVELYNRELDRTRRLLYEFVVSERFQEVLLFSSPGLSRFTPKNSEPSAVRNSHVRQREFTWISYLQRLATKNETISFFGPTAWGEFDLLEPKVAAIELSDRFIDRRSVYVERWVCEALAERFSQVSEIAQFLPLRLVDDLMVDGDQATLLKTGQAHPLSRVELEFLKVCSSTPKCMIDSPHAAALLEKGLLTQKIQIPPDTLPLACLRKIVDSWPDGPQRSVWQRNLTALESHSNAIELAEGFDARREALTRLQEFLIGLEIGDRNDSQRLYSSRLPVNEDCRLDCKKLVLGRPFVEQLLEDAAPWFDFWRDLAGLYATRLHEGMRKHWDDMGQKPVPLPLFLPSILKAWGEMSKLDQEIQQAWAEQLGDRCHQSVVTLIEDDTQFLRKRFKFRRMKAFDNMSPDLQIVAENADAMDDGRWSLLIAEIHPDFTPWENCFFLWCPDPDTFASDYACEGGQGHAVVIGNSLPYFGSAHTSLCVYPNAHRWTFIGGAPPDGMESVRGAEAFVVVTDDDVKLQDSTGRFLGSFLHTWQTAVNTHRLDLQGEASHSPRLQVGRVIVQRESWKVKPDTDQIEAAKAGGEGSYAAIRALREEHNLPERVYLRGILPQRMSLEKDVKPVYMDFRNPLLAEVASKMVGRFDGLLITEMLPTIGDCWLEGPGGHYSSEFRTVVMASQKTRSEESEATRVD